jgi:hypothetical protein
MHQKRNVVNVFSQKIEPSLGLSPATHCRHPRNDATKLTKRIGNAKEKNNFLHFKTQKSLSASEILKGNPRYEIQ